MIDLLIGAVIGGLIVHLIHHFKAPSLKTSPTLDLETIFEGVRNLMSQAADDLAAKIASLPAEIGASFDAKLADLQSQLDAERADHAADLTKLSEAVSAVTPQA